MPIEPGRPLIWCIRQTDVPAGAVIPPNVKTDRCAFCRHRVWLAPSSVGLVRDAKAQPVCRQCVPRDVALVPVVTEQAVRELREYVRQDVEKN